MTFEEILKQITVDIDIDGLGLYMDLYNDDEELIALFISNLKAIAEQYAANDEDSVSLDTLNTEIESKKDLMKIIRKSDGYNVWLSMICMAAWCTCNDITIDEDTELYEDELEYYIHWNCVENYTSCYESDVDLG